MTNNMMQPSSDMMAVVEKLAAFIAGGGKQLPNDLFATGPITIVENFAPYIFTSPGVWAKEMRAHLEDLTQLRAEFGPAFDLSRDGNDAYFSLHTTWSGLNRGQPFREVGGWALVLTRQSAAWRLKGYGWAVIETTVPPQ